MMEAPSGKKAAHKQIRLNLTPIMDFLMVVIFYFLWVSNPHVFKEIFSDVPITSDEEPKTTTPPLALTLKIENKNISLFSGVPEKLIKSFPKQSDGNFPLEELHSQVLQIKKNNPKEKQIILNPESDISYEEIVKIMDSIRMRRNTDDTILDDGQSVEILFNDIIFGNIQS
ncbi:MAG: biopolymer transporter ExbD [Bacteriovoracales bacterium]